MAAFNLLFILVFLLLGFAIYCCIATPILLLVIRFTTDRKRWLATGAVMIPVSYVLLLVGFNIWTSRPDAVFERAFGFPPPPTVEILHSDQSIVGDYGEMSLTFRSDRETLDRIIQPRFGISLAQAMQDSNGCYTFSREFSDSFAVETEILIYDPETQRTYYEWKGID